MINTARIAHSSRQRAEERVLCAILHATTPYGLYALAASVAVWITQRTRSRFVALQALQAMLFQLATLAAQLVTFGLFMASFFFAAFSGLIARTGYTEPELTSFLIAAWVFGMACVFFFQLILPLWGVWAAVRILRGRNFRYPILGQLAVRWATPESFTIRSERASDTGSSEPVLAALGYLGVLVGLSPILSPILWATTKHRSQFLSYHLLQAPLFQLIVAGASFIWFFGIWGLGLLSSLFGRYLPADLWRPVTLIIGSPVAVFIWVGTFAVLFLTTGLLSVIAAVRVFKGEEFRYPVVGSWLTNYLHHDDPLFLS
jgi:uncharacterized Tic20 family protein